MNPIASKPIRVSDPGMTSAASFSSAHRLSGGQPSKFDLVWKQIRTAQNTAHDVSLQHTEQIRENWQSNGVKLDQAVQRASALPPPSALDSVRVRLADLDVQYQNLGRAIDGISGSASPEQLLKIQRDMYRISENIGWISKTIDQLTTGVKSLLQTQI